MQTSSRSWNRGAWTCALLSVVALSGLARSQSAHLAHAASNRFGPDSLRLDSSYAIPSCAPTDGPAVTLYLGGTARAAGIAEHIDPPYVQISIWQAWSSLPGQSFVLQHYHGGGNASYCATAQTCVPLDGARATFDRATADHLTGSVDLTLQGKRLEKSFDARRLDIRVQCG
jgi:hypothetical protein